MGRPEFWRIGLRANFPLACVPIGAAMLRRLGAPQELGAEGYPQAARDRSRPGGWYGTHNGAATTRRIGRHGADLNGQVWDRRRAPHRAEHAGSIPRAADTVHPWPRLAPSIRPADYLCAPAAGRRCWSAAPATVERFSRQLCTGGPTAGPAPRRPPLSGELPRSREAPGAKQPLAGFPAASG